MRKSMPWPMMWLIIIVLLVAGYFVGQWLHLDHKAPTSASTSALVSSTPTPEPMSLPVPAGH